MGKDGGDQTHLRPLAAKHETVRPPPPFGSIVRKWLGHSHIPGGLAGRTHEFLRDSLSPFLNFHRPCLFAVEVTDARGKVRRHYPHEQIATPYERFRALPGVKAFLKPGAIFEALDRTAHAASDLDAAKAVSRARAELFSTIAQEIARKASTSAA